MSGDRLVEMLDWSVPAPRRWLESAAARRLGRRAWRALAVCRASARVGVTAAYPARDVTLALAPWHWDAEAVSPQQAAASCSSRRGSLGDSSLCAAHRVARCVVCDRRRVRSTWDARRSHQLEVISPERKSRRWLAPCLQTGSKGEQAGYFVIMTRASCCDRSFATGDRLLSRRHCALQHGPVVEAAAGRRRRPTRGRCAERAPGWLQRSAGARIACGDHALRSRQWQLGATWVTTRASGTASPR